MSDQLFEHAAAILLLAGLAVTTFARRSRLDLACGLFILGCGIGLAALTAAR